MANPNVLKLGLNANNALLFQLLAGENQQTLRTLQEGVSEIKLFMENINGLLQAQATENALKERRIALLETQITQLQETHQTELHATKAQNEAAQTALREELTRTKEELGALMGKVNELSQAFTSYNPVEQYKAIMIQKVKEAKEKGYI